MSALSATMAIIIRKTVLWRLPPAPICFASFLPSPPLFPALSSASNFQKLGLSELPHSTISCPLPSPSKIQCMGGALSPALCFGWPEKSSPDWAAPASLHNRGVSTDRRPDRQSALRCATETPTVSEERSSPQSARAVPVGSSEPPKRARKRRTEPPACLEDVPELSNDTSVNNFGLDDDEVIVSDWNYSSDDPDIRVLARGSSEYNSKIEVVELARTADHPLAGATLLLLDTANNIHSVYFK